MIWLKLHGDFLTTQDDDTTVSFDPLSTERFGLDQLIWRDFRKGRSQFIVMDSCWRYFLLLQAFYQKKALLTYNNLLLE